MQSFSLSPERFIRLSQGQVETRPIKGTRTRGLTPDEDLAQADDPLGSPKDRAENLMIVDLLRKRPRRSWPSAAWGAELFALESYPIRPSPGQRRRGELAEGKDALDLLAGQLPRRAHHRAPKIRAMEIIDELEPTRRSIYCGSLLYLDVRGEMDSSIAIRPCW